jgi:hypothetical protein
MAEARVKVLNMLAEGRLTAEQANRLLAAISDEGGAGTGTSDEELAVRPERRERKAEQRFGDFTFDQVLRMGTVGVEPTFFAKVRAAGLTDLSFEQILEMGTLGVEPEFVLRAREPGMPELTVEQIIQLGTVGVDPSFVQKVREAGLTELTFEQIVQMGTVGVEPEFFIRVREQHAQ